MGGRRRDPLLPQLFLVLSLLLVSPLCSIAAPYPDWPAPDDSDEPPSGSEPVHFHRGDDEFTSLLDAASGRSNVLTVTHDPAKHGQSGVFKSIQAAIDAVPDVTTERWVIKIEPGVYFGQVEIEKKDLITLYGDPQNPRNVVLQARHTAGDVDTEGRVYGTYRSPSLIIRGDDFTAIGVTFINLSDRPLPGSRGAQAVAVRATGDRHQFYNCIFSSFQDTLYAHKGRQLYKNCLIEGTIDFIFGYAQAQFEDCNIHARADPYSFTAQKRNLSTDPNGFIFLRCNLTCEPSLPGQGQAYLGRTWGVHARTYFIDSYLYDVVYPPGWSNMGFPGRELTASFGEYNNTGPGADTSRRVSWAKTLTPAEVAPYRDPARPFIDGTVWVTPPADLGPTPDPLVMCSGHDETGYAQGPMPDLPPETDVPPPTGLPPAAYRSVEAAVSAMDARQDFSTFLFFLAASGLESELADAPPQSLTFFPPTDAAFEVLDNYTVAVLTKDVNLLKRVLQYHIALGFYPDAVLLASPPENLPTLAGFAFPVLNRPGVGVFVGQDLKAEVTKHDVFVDQASFTAVQGINRVLLSPYVDYLVPPVPVPAPVGSATAQPPVGADSPQTAATSLFEGVRLAEVAEANSAPGVVTGWWTVAVGLLASLLLAVWA